MSNLSRIKIPRWITVSCGSIFLLAVLWISNSIFNYISVFLQIIGYALLVITICCCYEAYFKIRRNKGYIYVALICLLLILPGAIQGLISIFSPRPSIRTESVMQNHSNASNEPSYNSPAIIKENVTLHLPMVELLLLLTVLKFSSKDDEDRIAENNTLESSSPDS